MIQKELDELRQRYADTLRELSEFKNAAQVQVAELQAEVAALQMERTLTTTLTTTHCLRAFEGDEWCVVVDGRPHELQEVFVRDVADCCGVPTDHVTNVRFAVGSLHAEFDVTHPSSIPSDELNARLGAHTFTGLMDLYERRHAEKVGLDKAKDDIRALETRLAGATKCAQKGICGNCAAVGWAKEKRAMEQVNAELESANRRAARDIEELEADLVRLRDENTRLSVEKTDIFQLVYAARDELDKANAYQHEEVRVLRADLESAIAAATLNKEEMERALTAKAFLEEQLGKQINETQQVTDELAATRAELDEVPMLKSRLASLEEQLCIAKLGLEAAEARMRAEKQRYHERLLALQHQEDMAAVERQQLQENVDRGKRTIREIENQLATAMLRNVTVEAALAASSTTNREILSELAVATAYRERLALQATETKEDVLAIEEAEHAAAAESAEVVHGSLESDTAALHERVAKLEALNNELVMARDAAEATAAAERASCSAAQQRAAAVQAKASEIVKAVVADFSQGHSVEESAAMEQRVVELEGAVAADERRTVHYEGALRAVRGALSTATADRDKCAEALITAKDELSERTKLVCTLEMQVAELQEEVATLQMERTLTTTHCLRAFEGDEWCVVVDGRPHELQEVFVRDVADCCGVPTDHVTNVSFAVGSLHAEFDVTHPSSIPSDELNARLGAHTFTGLMDLYERRHAEKVGLDKAQAEVLRLKEELRNATKSRCGSVPSDTTMSQFSGEESWGGGQRSQPRAAPGSSSRSCGSCHGGAWSTSSREPSVKPQTRAGLGSTQDVELSIEREASAGVEYLRSGKLSMEEFVQIQATLTELEQRCSHLAAEKVAAESALKEAQGDCEVLRQRLETECELHQEARRGHERLLAEKGMRAEELAPRRCFLSSVERVPQGRATFGDDSEWALYGIMQEIEHLQRESEHIAREYESARVENASLRALVSRLESRLEEEGRHAAQAECALTELQQTLAEVPRIEAAGVLSVANVEGPGATLTESILERQRHVPEPVTTPAELQLTETVVQTGEPFGSNHGPTASVEPLSLRASTAGEDDASYSLSSVRMSSCKHCILLQAKYKDMKRTFMATAAQLRESQELIKEQEAYIALAAEERDVA